jgi:3'-5' exoribonuclease
MPDIHIVQLHELQPDQEADVFAFLVEKVLLKTKEGKPYIRVVLRDSLREVKFPVWSDSVVYKDFKLLKPGMYVKLRGVYRVTASFGSRLEVRRIRVANEGDVKDGFNPLLLCPISPISVDVMFEELLGIASGQIGKGKLLNVVTRIFKEYRMLILTCAVSRHNHHSYVGGFLEHTLSVTKIVVSLIDHYHSQYPDRRNEISRPLTVAGAILHDVGKLREYDGAVGSQRRTVEGELLGHAILGRDIVRESAMAVELDENLRVRLEHIIVAHQRLPEWGAVKPPMSVEAIIVHHADSCDAMINNFRIALTQDNSNNNFIPQKNPLGYPLLKPK